MYSDNTILSDKYLKESLALLQLIQHSKQQVFNNKTTNQKDVFKYMEKKYFNTVNTIKESQYV